VTNLFVPGCRDETVARAQLRAVLPGHADGDWVFRRIVTGHFGNVTAHFGAT
jgi:hypothetical protein